MTREGEITGAKEGKPPSREKRKRSSPSCAIEVLSTRDNALGKWRLTRGKDRGEENAILSCSGKEKEAELGGSEGGKRWLKKRAHRLLRLLVQAKKGKGSKYYIPEKGAILISLAGTNIPYGRKKGKEEEGVLPKRKSRLHIAGRVKKKAKKGGSPRCSNRGEEEKKESTGGTKVDLNSRGAIDRKGGGRYPGEGGHLYDGGKRGRRGVCPQPGGKKHAVSIRYAGRKKTPREIAIL